MIFAENALQDRVAIITGGGTGIGRGIALAFAKAGADIVVASRKIKNLERVAEEVRALGRRALAVQTDVRDPAQVNNMVERTVEHFGQVDILVNNAAGNFRVPAEEMSVNAWNVVINIDLNGTFYCSQAFCGAVRSLGRGGSILNIGSTGSWMGRPGTAHAGAAKAGIWSLTKSLAVEWAKYGIRVNCVAPGPVPTEGVTRYAQGYQGADWQDAWKGREIAVPLGRLGLVEDIAYAVVFLVSDAASWITGATLVVDGGSSLAGRQYSASPTSE